MNHIFFTLRIGSMLRVNFQDLLMQASVCFESKILVSPMKTA